ncbi:unnamed protein product [Polarella glacialis]|uniref:DUF4145 domain-containing protein n=1 Tax=Polarella glacialis TaxID=89957 RepID=A0A813KV35_POLGL|nr:unnamed protein product [Polarella glacialis]
MAVEQADMQHELHVQARRDLEQWKSQEKASLLADVKFACEVAKGEQQEQQEQLCNVMQHCRDGLKQISELEKDRDELRARAEQAEAALQVQQESSVRRAQKRPVFSTRTEHIAKRVCAEHDLRLREFDGDLFSKINQAFQARKITRREKDDMHQARMEGNRAAHEPQGYFGTQVAASDAFDIGSGHDVWASGDCLDEPDEDSADEVAWQS